MCLIIASPTGKRIPDNIIEDASKSNKDGGGVAWSDKGKIFFKKGLTVQQVISLLDGDAKDKSHVVHFRIATIGGVCDELTHPFSIDARASIDPEGEADAVLFQNGTFSNWREYLLQASASSRTPVPEPPWSDSRAVAFLCHVYGKHVLSLLDNTSRFLVFDAKESVSKRMMLWGTWHTSGDFKFSTTNNIAFRTHSNHGGGSTNFQSGAGEVDEAEIEVNVTTTAPETSSRQTSTESKTSQPNSVLVTPSAIKRKFRPKGGHDYWRLFDKNGTTVKADNEITKAEALPSV